MSVNDINKYLNKVGLQVRPWEDNLLKKGVDNLKHNAKWLGQKVLGIGNKDASADAQQQTQAVSQDEVLARMNSPEDPNWTDEEILKRWGSRDRNEWAKNQRTRDWR